MVSVANIDVIGRSSVGQAMSGGQTMPMLGAGMYQMSTRGVMPVVSVNDPTFSQMRMGTASWADVAKVASENQATISGTVSRHLLAFLKMFKGSKHEAGSESRSESVIGWTTERTSE